MNKFLFAFLSLVFASGELDHRERYLSSYTCSASSVVLNMRTKTDTLKDTAKTTIGFTSDGRLTWAINKQWDDEATEFDAFASARLTLNGFGIYENSSLVSPLFNPGYEPLNYGVYPKATGLINPITADVYSGCNATSPNTSTTWTYWACSNQVLSTFGGDIAMPSVPRYPNRTFCAGFNFATQTIDGYQSPSTTDAVMSPIDFVSLCQGQRPGPGQLYGLSITLETTTRVERYTDGDFDGLLADLTRIWWDRRGDATARGLVYAEILSSVSNPNSGKIVTEMVYTFELSAGTPMTFVTRWDPGLDALKDTTADSTSSAPMIAMFY